MSKLHIFANTLIKYSRISTSCLGSRGSAMLDLISSNKSYINFSLSTSTRPACPRSLLAKPPLTSGATTGCLRSERALLCGSMASADQNGLGFSNEGPPHARGLTNVGNSCFLNCVLQVICFVSLSTSLWMLSRAAIYRYARCALACTQHSSYHAFRACERRSGYYCVTR